MGIAESSAADDKELVARFGEEYRLAQSKVMRDIESKICGCDYGGTSWMTRQEARKAGELLQLGPGRRLLEVGAGSGWPGLYLAGTTGCDAILVDLPFEGIKIAAERVASEGLTGTCWLAVADGTALPLKSWLFRRCDPLRCPVLFEGEIISPEGMPAGARRRWKNGLYGHIDHCEPVAGRLCAGRSLRPSLR